MLSDPGVFDENRQGRLTAEQRQMLHAQNPWNAFGLGMNAVMLALTFMPLWAVRDVPMPASSRLIYWFIPVIGFLFILPYWRRAYAFRQEIGQPDIVVGTVEIAWRRGRLAAQTPAGELKPLQGKIELLPGTYHGCYLRRSLFLLSAQPISVDMLSARAAQAQNLARRLHFHPDDLEANRRGYISARQRRRLLRQLGLHAVGLALGALLLVGAAGDIVESGEITAAAIISYVPLLLLAAGGAAYLGQRIIRYGRDVASQRCLTVSGAVRTRISGGYRSRQVYLLVNGMEFPIPARAYEAIVEGARCRVYYLPHSREIAGMEPL